MNRLQLARRGAHTPQARVLRHLPRQSARGGVIFCAHAQESYLLEAAAGTSERGRAPRKRAVSLAQWASTEHGSTPTSAAWRAHGASARATPSPKRERAVALSRVCARECRLLVVGGRGWHVRARPCSEGEGRLTGAVGFHRAGTDSNHAAWRTHAACARATPPPEREIARDGVFFLRTCARKLLVGGRGWHVGARPCTEREAR